MATKYRKKPVVIEAMRYEPGTPACGELHDWLGLEHHPESCAPGAPMGIDTLEGTITASPGDWIIRGVQGEFYPCKPDIFEATYEPAGESDDAR